MKIAIYKVCDSSGACLYAGQTAKPKARFSQHRRKFKNAVCKIVKWVSALRFAVNDPIHLAPVKPEDCGFAAGVKRALKEGGHNQ